MSGNLLVKGWENVRAFYNFVGRGRVTRIANFAMRGSDSQSSQWRTDLCLPFLPTFVTLLSLLLALGAAVADPAEAPAAVAGVLLLADAAVLADGVTVVAAAGIAVRDAHRQRRRRVQVHVLGRRRAADRESAHAACIVTKVAFCPRGKLLYMQIYLITDQNLLLGL